MSTVSAQPRTEFSKPLLATLLAAALGLSACGGGGGGSDAAATTVATDTGSTTSGSGAPSTTTTTNTTDGASTAAAVEPSPEADAAGMATTVVEELAQGNAKPKLTIRAQGTLAGGVGPVMQVRVDGVVVGSATVSSTTLADYVISTPTLKAGAAVDVVFTNDAVVNGEDRNLTVSTISDGTTTVWPASSVVTYDRGGGNTAFDGVDVVAGTSGMWWGGALRFKWPTASTATKTPAAQYAAARFLQQATFGATPAEVQRLAGMTYAAWFNEQIAKPVTPDFVSFVQAKYDQGDAWRPNGANYTDAWPSHRFWSLAATAPDALRKRMAFALHGIFVSSQGDSNLWAHSRAYASYMDQLNRLAFDNYRNVLEEVALSPAMGIYLSHMRNRKEDLTTGRLPDENFAREVMQLFSIGLVELNQDGSVKLGADGKPIDTYGNADVMALAKVFTGWSWAFPDAQLTDTNFRWGSPNYATASDTKMDLQRMKAYPSQHSAAEKRLFAGKAWAVTVPAGATPQTSLKLALDGLFNHPNVAPFISRQLIQRFTTSHPSPAYVGRVAAVFNNNGKGVRGDLGAVLRAVLLDAEARAATPAANFGKVKEPILRVSQWMRAFDVRSSTGDFLMGNELGNVLQQALRPASVFGYFRPGYVPPGTSFASTGTTVPELQIVNESTTANWVNLAESMAGSGLGWTGSARDVSSTFAALAALSTAGKVDAMVEQLNVLLFAGRMSAALKQDIYDAVGGVGGVDAASHTQRARVAAFVALSSPDFVVQR